MKGVYGQQNDLWCLPEHRSFFYVYNNRDFLLSKSGPDETISYTYNHDGSRSSMVDRGTQITSYTYHQFSGQLTGVTYPDGKTLAYTYDNRGNRASMTTPFGDLAEYEYDVVNQLSSVKWKEAPVASFNYLGNGQLETKNAGYNLLTQTYSYTDGRLTGLEHLQGVNVVRNYTYDYDKNANITAINEYNFRPNSLTSSETFAYDNLNRISTASLLDETYTYDNRGNRQTIMTDAEMDLSDVSYEYDAWDRLTKVTREGQVVEYAYNGDNLMVERKHNGVTTRYYYDGDQIIAEGTVGGNGNVAEVATYIRSGTELILRDDAYENKGYYLHNGHGDVTEMLAINGQVLNQYEYDIWGKPLRIQAPMDNPFLYSGEYWDDTTQLQYLRARWYDPSVGRFINEDTYEGELNNPLSQNLYTYVHNNPVFCFLRGELKNVGISSKSA
ncbi:RHS repeat domain-containing protein [Paenibacillus sp. 1P07SE]|uniref:RHS repeat domain-containing protein n=1 Tax=Paenibacillus sp. 1P07SE TaxID=3132209 RepID=UPI0039A60B9B